MTTLFDIFVPPLNASEETYFEMEQKVDQHEEQLSQLEDSLEQLTRMLRRYQEHRDPDDETSAKERSEIRKAYLIHRGSLECTIRRRRTQAALEDELAKARLEIYGN